MCSRNPCGQIVARERENSLLLVYVRGSSCRVCSHFAEVNGNNVNKK